MVEFSNGTMTVVHEVFVRVDVSDAPRFEAVGSGRTFRECKELVPQRLLMTYINHVPRIMMIECRSVRANGTPGSAEVMLRWSSSRLDDSVLATLSRRPIPDWALKFLEEPAGIALAIMAGAKEE